MVSSRKGISTISSTGCWRSPTSRRGSWLTTLRDGKPSPKAGAGKTVEFDETYIGRLQGKTNQRSGAHRNIAITLVERGGVARSFHIDSTILNKITKIVRQNVNRESIINTDEGRW